MLFSSFSYVSRILASTFCLFLEFFTDVVKIGLPRVRQSVFKEDGLLELINCDPGEDFGNWDRFFHDLRDFDTDFVHLHIPHYGLCD